MTQLEYALSGVTTKEMQIVADYEGVPEEFILEGVKKGEINTSNVNHINLVPKGIGKGLSTKVNANIGTSDAFPKIGKEIEKLKVAIEAGTDAIMDLSTGGNVTRSRRKIIKNLSVPVGTAPIREGQAAVPPGAGDPGCQPEDGIRETPREIEGAQLEYIVEVRMRKLKAAQEVLARPGRYHKVAANLWVKEVIHQGCGRSCASIRRRRSATARHASRRWQGLRRGSTLGNSSSSSATAHTLRTNFSLSSKEVTEAYKSLWQVERAFRELKSGLDLRPIYHWTEKRIWGYVMVCFLALVLEMVLRRKIKDICEEVRYDDFLLELCQLKAVDLHVDGSHYLARTELRGSAEVAFRALGVRPPLHVTEMPRA